jgi:hypothetical protein
VCIGQCALDSNNVLVEAIMSTNLPPEDEPKWRRRLGSAANNRAWTLSEKLLRTAQEDEEMLHAAHASAHLWSAIGNERNAAFAHLLLGQVHALLGNAALAERFAGAASRFFSSHAGEPSERATMHAVAANAAHCRGDRDAHAREYAAALGEMEAISNPQEKEIFLATLRVVPKPSDAS